MKKPLMTLVLVTIISFWIKCVAGDGVFSLPDKISESDKVIVYKIKMSDANSLRTGKLLQGYTIVAESGEVSTETATNLYLLLKRATPFTEPKGKDPIWPCMFVPTIGISFEMNSNKVDAVVSFDCNKMCLFSGPTSRQNFSLSNIRKDLLIKLKTIFPKDEEIQSLK